MQRVEYVEECLLCAGCLVGPKLYVVDYQHIHHFVVMHKVRRGSVASGVHVLLHKLLRRDVQHGKVGVKLLCLQSDSVCQMGFAQSYAAV